MSFKAGVKGQGSDRYIENEVWDCDDVICAGWGELGGERSLNRMRSTKRSWFHRWGGNVCLKERLATCSDDDTNGRDRLKADDERVDWTEISLFR